MIKYVKLSLLFVLGGLLLIGCGGAEEVASTGPSVQIVSPSDGAEVTSPVKFQMAAANYTIEPAGEVKDNHGHFHLLVDTGCMDEGEVIPGTAGYNHYGKGQFEAELELEPGEHTVCLQVGDGVHAATTLTDEITITVTE